MNVLYLDIELRSVECRLVDTDAVFEPDVVKDLLHNALSFLPLLGSSLVLVGTGGIPL